jgi:hypothetical protein
MVSLLLLKEDMKESRLRGKTRLSRMSETSTLPP